MHGKSEERSLSISVLDILNALGAIASIAGLIFAIACRTRDKRNQKLKESNRQAKG